jgi:pyridoxal phosphate enzyme (YggS family)
VANLTAYGILREELAKKQVKLIAVSKTVSVDEMLLIYHAGQKSFGENRALEMKEKYEQLPKDIEWHMIGTLQTNKVKYIAPFVSMIHSVDSLKLLEEIDRQAKKNNRVIDCLLEVFIADEETKHGFATSPLTPLQRRGEKEASSELSGELIDVVRAAQQLKNVRICGLMGMATFTDDVDQVRKEFSSLRQLRDEINRHIGTSAHRLINLSMGMTSDYKIAIEEGSTMVRVGSLIFGERK